MRTPFANIFMCVMLVGAVSTYAGDAGVESPFTVGVGARALGMGGAFTSLADDASAIYYNPAGLPNLENQEVALMYMDLFEGTIYNFAGWVYPDLKLGGFGIGYMRIGTDDIIRRDNFIDVGNFDYSHSQFLISYGKKMQGGLSIGLTFKILNQSIDEYSDYGFGFDLGMMGKISKYITAGATIRDMVPPELELKQSSEITPIAVAGGLSVKDLPLGVSTRLTAAFELEKIENRSTKVHGGAEFVIDDNYSLRAGYDRDNLAFGAGLKYRRLKLDYTYKILEYIEDSHRFSLAFLMGTSISEQRSRIQQAERQKGSVLLEDERHRQFEFYKLKADDFYSKFRLDSALVYYQRALAFEERNQEIVGTIAAIENSIRIQQAEQQRIQQTRLDLQKSVENFYVQAQNFFNKKYYRAALDMLNLILDINPYHFEVNELKKSIEIAISNDIASELQAGTKAEEDKDYVKALESYNRVLELDPENQKATLARERVAANLDIAQQLNKGIELFNAGNLARARAAISAVLSVDRKNQIALEYLKKIEAASETPATLEELQKNKVIWQLYLDGLRYMRNKEYDKAIEAWEKVLEAYPNNINTINNIEQARLRLKSEQPD